MKEARTKALVVLKMVYRFFVSIRFAIPVLFGFAAAMVYGTILESWYGTSFALRTVYHTWWFYALQGCLVLSIALALVDRLPFQKRLIGFYLVHLSFVVIWAGALITRYWGIDGSITLNPDQPSRMVQLSHDDVVYVSDGQFEAVVDMPFSAHAVDLGKTVPFVEESSVSVRKFLPFAKPEQRLVPSLGAWISTWRLTTQPKGAHDIQISNGVAGIPSQIDLGPVFFKTVSPEMFQTLTTELGKVQQNFSLIHVKTGDILPIPKLRKTTSVKHRNNSLTLTQVINPKLGMMSYDLKSGNQRWTFFPRFSFFPVKKDQLLPDTTAPYQLIDLAAFRDRNTVFVTPNRNKNQTIDLLVGNGTHWETVRYDSKAIDLPWMDLRLALVDQVMDQAPQWHFVPTPPKKDAARNLKAALVEIHNNPQDSSPQSMWLNDKNMTTSTMGHKSIRGFVGSRVLFLPFEMQLESFKMEKIPGTDRPASFESFVRVGPEQRKIHIYMNHPFKANGFTFYQSSYFKGRDGRFSSVLSVNKDPGRIIKYAGSGLLVLGLILQFLVMYGFLSLGPKPNIREAS